MPMITENSDNGLLPEPLEADDTASSISSADIVPGCQSVTKPAESMMMTASVAPLGNALPTAASASSMSRGHDSLRVRE